MQVTTGIRWLAEQGVTRLILTNAAGSLRSTFPPGQWMMLSDHLNLTGTSPLEGGPNFIDMSEVYSRNWREKIRSHAKKLMMPLHEGVYAGLRGPQYETPAEIRMLQTLGADAVGMSTVLESLQARALGMEVLGFSCLTNWGAGLSDEGLDHTEVLDVGKAAAAQMVRLLTDAFVADGPKAA
jgi:purine-nucleoside phosphorylase